MRKIKLTYLIRWWNWNNFNIFHSKFTTMMKQPHFLCNSWTEKCNFIFQRPSCTLSSSSSSFTTVSYLKSKIHMYYQSVFLLIWSVHIILFLLFRVFRLVWFKRIDFLFCTHQFDRISFKVVEFIRILIRFFSQNVDVYLFFC